MSQTNIGKVKHVVLYILDYSMIGLSLIIPLLKYYNVQFGFMSELSIITSALLVVLLLLRSIMHYFLNEKHKRAKMEILMLEKERVYTNIENNELKNYLESFKLPIEHVVNRAREIYRNTPSSREPDANSDETAPTVVISPDNKNDTPKSDTTTYEQPINMTSFFQKLKNIVTSN